MDYGREVRIDHTDATAPLTFEALWIGERAYYQNLPPEQQERQLRGTIHRMISFPRLDWLRNFGRKAEIEREGIDEKYPVPHIDRKNHTFPTTSELNHPVYWIKLLRYNDAIPFPDQKRSAFFFERAVNTAIDHLRDGDTKTRTLMLGLVLDLVINQYTDIIGYCPYTKQNKAALEKISDRFEESLASHVDKIFALPISLEERAAVLQQTLKIMREYYQYIADAPNPLKEIHDRAANMFVNRVIGQINEVFCEEDINKALTICDSVYVIQILESVIPALESTGGAISTLCARTVDTMLTGIDQKIITKNEAFTLIKNILLLENYIHPQHWKELKPATQHLLEVFITGTLNSLIDPSLFGNADYRTPIEGYSNSHRYIEWLPDEHGPIGRIEYITANALKSVIKFRLSYPQSNQGMYQIELINEGDYNVTAATRAYLEILGYFAALRNPIAAELERRAIPLFIF